MNKKYILPGLFAALMMASCADEFNPEFPVQRPVDLAKLAELEDYQPLKEYIDRSAHPTFKLGGALDAAEFTKKGVVYNVGVNNFDEVVAGNTMKYASCVDPKGNMDFTTVNNFVTAADQAGISVYGHTLAWHAQQQPKYLSSLIADKPKPVDPNAGGITQEVEVTDYAIDWSLLENYNMWGQGDGVEVTVNGGLNIHNTHAQANFWECQYQVANNVPTVTGQHYGIRMEIKAVADEGAESANVRFKLGDWSGGIEGSKTVTADGTWQTFLAEGNATCDNSFLLVQFGDFVGTVSFKAIQVFHTEEQVVTGPIEQTVQDYFIDWTSQASYNMWGAGDGVEVSVDGGLNIHNTHAQPNFWECQYQVANNVPTTTGEKYKIRFVAKAVADEGAESANVRFKLGDWSGGIEGSKTVVADGSWQEFTAEGAATCDNSFFLVQFGDFVGTVSFKEIEVSHTEMVEVGGDAPEYMEVEKEVKKRVLQVKSSDLVDYAWDTQFWFKTNEPMHAGDEFALSVDVYAYKEAKAGTQLHNAPGEYVHWSAVGDFKFTTEWETFTATGSIPSEGDGTSTVALNLNDFAEANTYFFANFSFKINGKEQINNGNLATDDNSSFFSKESRGDIVNTPILDSYIMKELVEKPKTEEQFINKRCIIVRATEMVEYGWDNQFWVVANEPFHAGDTYEFSAEIRATHAAAPGTQIHGANPGSYMHWAAVGNPSFTEDWETWTSSGTIPSEGDGGQSIAFNLNDYADANDYMFGNISFKINGKEMVNNGDLKGDDTSSFYQKLDRGATVHSVIEDGYTITSEIKSTIPLTPEEKHDTLVWAMDKWIAGMMEACEGKVKAWDVVNEAISGGGDDGEGNYPLQHGTEEDDKNFFWQDHMGDLEYVRQAVRLARKYYAKSLEEAGGDDGKLKLFINDYNLESDWDQNKKVKSLINWIKKWEEDGVTKIDGIGTQMHISYYENPAILESKKAAIVESFKLMAATGKLVRISELDMGYVKADGTDATLDDMDNAEQVAAGYPREKAMEEYYKWIIEQYFTIIPEAQQYGITQWCLTDAPSGAGWRPDTPVGIWDTNWNRKYIYRGWTEALSK